MLSGKLSLVTGASSGIGLAVAKLFAEQGALVVMLDLNPIVKEKVNELAKVNNEHSYTHSAYLCDVSKSDQVKSVFQSVKETYPAIKAPNVVVNSAGIFTFAEFIDLTEETYDRVMGVNLKGTFLVSQAAARALIENYDESKLAPGDTYGSIINISSAQIWFSEPYRAHYGATKGGVEGLTKNVARELGKYKIRVNAVAPGATRTPIANTLPKENLPPISATMKEYNPQLMEQHLELIAIHRVAEAEEVAQTCLYLASNMSSYVTGQTIVHDGGLSA